MISFEARVLDEVECDLLRELDEAERRAWDSLARYKFMQFGYWAAIWVHLNRIGRFNKPNPRRRRTMDKCTQLQKAKELLNRLIDDISSVAPRTLGVEKWLALANACSDALSHVAGKDLPQGVTYSCTDPDANTWACSGCDAVWTFSEDGPKEHNMRYCPQCGRPIVKVVEYRDPYEDVPRCRVCGCTEDEPCEGGCYWVEDPEGLGELCSRCFERLYPEEARKRG